MLPTCSGRVKAGVLSLLSTACMTAAAIGASAQSLDPFVDQPIDRRSAALPLAYGLIVSADVPVWRGALSNATEGLVEPEKKVGFGVDAYFDTWQFGYNVKSYGNMVSIMARSVGRDCYSGLFFEFGSKDVNVLLDATQNYGNGDERVYDTVAASWRAYGIGARRITGLGEKTTFSFQYEAALGIATRAGIDSNDASVTMPYVMTDVGVGARIPISITSLNIGAILGFGYGPPMQSLSNDLQLEISLRLKASVALNLSL